MKRIAVIVIAVLLAACTEQSPIVKTVAAKAKYDTTVIKKGQIASVNGKTIANETSRDLVVITRKK